MLKIRDLTAGYGKSDVIQGVSVNATQAQITGVIGLNGAGKTTLLRCISGLVPARKGSIEFNMVNITHMPVHKIAALGIAHVPEGRQIFGQLTVKENLMIGCYLNSNIKSVEKEQQLRLVFNLFPILQERLSQKAWSLSGGQQQMLAIARGLMGLPKFLILDEPSLGLAPALIVILAEALRKINREGVTILLVEQNTRLTVQVADYIYVLENGQIKNEGTKAQIKEKVGDLYFT